MKKNSIPLILSHCNLQINITPRNLKSLHTLPTRPLNLDDINYDMEGLIPLVYRAIMQYKNGQQGMMGSWTNESPSASYMRLPGDSGRFQMPDIQLFRPDCAFPASASSPSSSATKRMLSAAVQSPGCHLTPRRAVKWISINKNMVLTILLCPRKIQGM